MELLLSPLSSRKALAWQRGRAELLHSCSSRRKWKELVPCPLRAWGTESIWLKMCVGKNGTSAVVTLRIPVAGSLGNRSGLQGLGFLFNGFLLMHRSETSGKCQYLLVSTDSNVRPCQQQFSIPLNNINYEQHCNVLHSINL